MRRHGPPGPLEAGPVELVGGQGVAGAAGHGPRAAVAQALVAGAGGPRGAGGVSGGGQRVRQAALAPHLPPKAAGLVHLGQRREVHDVVVAVQAEVRRALPGLVAVLQQDGGARLVRRPAALVVGPLPVDAAAQPGGLGEKGAPHRPGFSWREKQYKSGDLWGLWIEKRLCGTITLQTPFPISVDVSSL